MKQDNYIQENLSDYKLGVFKDLNDLIKRSSNDFGDFHRENTVSMKEMFIEDAVKLLIKDTETKVKKELREEVENIEVKGKTFIGKMNGINQGYNQAIQDIINLLK